MLTKIVFYLSLACAAWLSFMLLAHLQPEQFDHPVVGVLWQLVTIPVIIVSVLSVLYSIVNTFQSGTDRFQKYLWIANVLTTALLLFIMF